MSEWLLYKTENPVVQSGSHYDDDLEGAAEYAGIHQAYDHSDRRRSDASLARVGRRHPQRSDHDLDDLLRRAWRHSDRHAKPRASRWREISLPEERK